MRQLLYSAAIMGHSKKQKQAFKAKQAAKIHKTPVAVTPPRNPSPPYIPQRGTFSNYFQLGSPGRYGVTIRTVLMDSFPDLLPTHVDSVRELMRSDEENSDVEGGTQIIIYRTITLHRSSFASLCTYRPDTVTDEIIYYYMQMLQVRSSGEAFIPVHAMNMLAYSQIMAWERNARDPEDFRTPEEVHHYWMDMLKEFASGYVVNERKDIFNKDQVEIILLPVNYNGNHWILFAVDNVKKIITLYDSIYKPGETHVKYSKLILEY